VDSLLRDARTIKRFTDLQGTFKKYAAGEVETAMKEARYTQFFGIEELKLSSPDVVKGVAEAMDLDVRNTFHLLEVILAEDPKRIVKVVKNQGNSDEVVNSLLGPFIKLYNEEIVSQYQIISVCLSTYQGSKEFSYSPALKNFVDKLNAGNSLLTKLWQQYKELGAQTVPKAMKGNLNEFFVTKTKQEFWILMCIFKGISMGFFTIDADLYEDMFNTFIDQEFRGAPFGENLANDDMSDFNFAHSEAYIDGKERTHFLSSLILIAGLRISELLGSSTSLVTGPGFSTLKIICDKSDGITEKLRLLDQENEETLLGIAHFALAFAQVIDYYGSIVQRDPSQKGLEMKITNIIQKNFKILDLSFNEPISLLMKSNFYNVFSVEEEKAMIKKVVKELITLIIMPKSEVNFIETMSEEDSNCVATSLVGCVDSVQELEFFWSTFSNDEALEAGHHDGVQEPAGHLPVAGGHHAEAGEQVGRERVLPVRLERDAALLGHVELHAGGRGVPQAHQRLDLQDDQPGSHGVPKQARVAAQQSHSDVRGRDSLRGAQQRENSGKAKVQSLEHLLDKYDFDRASFGREGHGHFEHLEKAAQARLQDHTNRTAYVHLVPAVDADEGSTGPFPYSGK
jgi:hypothetical protein